MRIVSEIMTSDPISIEGTASISEAARLMRDNDVGILPVMREGQVVGVITDRDIIVRAVAAARFDEPVSTVATAHPVMLEADDDEDQAAALMSEYDVRRLPVVRNGHIVGIVSVGDLATRAEAHLAGAVIKNTGPGASVEAGTRGLLAPFDEIELAAARFEAFMQNGTVSFKPRET